MSTVEAEFNNYDWSQSAEWQTYLENIFPTPPATKIIKYKRKFYRTKINSELPENPPVDESPAAASPSTNSQPPRSAAYTPPPTGGLSSRFGQTFWKPIAVVILAVAVCCTLSSFLPIPIQPMLNRLARGLLALGLIAAAFSENGRPRMNVEWWQLLCYNAHMQALSLLLVGSTMNNALTIFSPAITAANFVASRLGYSSEFLTRLLLNKPYVEIAVGVLAIFAFFTRTTSFLSLILYWNTIRLLYAVNAPLKRAFANINSGVLNIMASPRVPPVIRNNYISATNWLWTKCESP